MRDIAMGRMSHAPGKSRIDHVRIGTAMKASTLPTQDPAHAHA